MPATGYLCKMALKKDISLKPYNTFGVDAKARYLFEIKSVSELKDAIGFLKKKKHSVFVLGGGSNVLFANNFRGVILLNRIRGMKLVDENDDFLLLKVAGGETWPELVDFCVSNNWGGIENLSLIPGTAGAAPIQNIGAYGVEVKEVITSVEAVDLLTGEVRVFANRDCAFSYRSSIFKTTKKGRYFVTHVTFKLNKKPRVNLDYTPLKKAFEGRDKSTISVKEVSDAVKKIRRSKLPDPLEKGNAGSFFKNPVVDEEMLNRLKAQFPDIPSYSVSRNRFKLAAGWLIEQAGWKGKRFGDAGVCATQALVIINHGNASGIDIAGLAAEIRISVQKQFDVKLEFEVRIV